MNTLNNDPRAVAARKLATQINCFSRESTGKILLWIEETERKTFRPKDIEIELPEIDYRTVGAALASLVQNGFISHGEKVPTDGRAREYKVQMAHIKAIATIVQGVM